MNITKNPLDLIGRIMIAILFIPAAIGKIKGFDNTVGYITNAGLPMPQIAAIGAIAVELLAPLAILIGFKTRWAAIILAMFVIAAAFGFHSFWTFPVDQERAQSIQFYKNIAIAGGLFILAAHSAGDKKRQFS